MPQEIIFIDPAGPALHSGGASPGRRPSGPLQHPDGVLQRPRLERQHAPFRPDVLHERDLREHLGGHPRGHRQRHGPGLR